MQHVTLAHTGHAVYKRIHGHVHCRVTQSERVQPENHPSRQGDSRVPEGKGEFLETTATVPHCLYKRTDQHQNGIRSPRPDPPGWSHETQQFKRCLYFEQHHRRRRRIPSSNDNTTSTEDSTSDTKQSGDASSSRDSGGGGSSSGNCTSRLAEEESSSSGASTEREEPPNARCSSDEVSRILAVAAEEDENECCDGNEDLEEWRQVVDDMTECNALSIVFVFVF